MNHVTEEQFEQILHGVETKTDHLANCGLCRDRLAQKQALADRLRSAFASIGHSEELAQRIRRRINVRTVSKEQSILRDIFHIHAHWKGWAAVTSVAAAIIVLVPLIMYFSAPPSALAAQAELVKIHEHNLSPDHEFYSEADPEELVAYFKDKLGFDPLLPKPVSGLALRGCCVRHFQGQIVGSYVVDTPEGVMSVIVVTDKPESLGFVGKFKLGQQIYYKGSFAKCDMVSVRIGGYSYCAVGEISHRYLTDLLSRLLSEQE
jgi:hypothetical protein